MEENNIGEQPTLSAGAEAQNALLSENEKGASNIAGSQFGKFKSADDLFVAYQNLEQEFTKKSQRLKSLEKQSEQVDNTEIVPAYEGKEWFKTVQNFYESNPKAKGFEKEISELILSDKQLAKSQSPLEDAWKNVASKHYKTEEEIVGDNDFINNYVLNNPQIQETVLKTYLENTKKAPSLISSSKGKQINVAIKSVPKTLEQARGEVEKLFK